MILDTTKTVIINVNSEYLKTVVKSKSFNFFWLLNPLAVMLCILFAVTISFFANKYGGEMGLLTSMYPAFMLGRVAFLFVFDPIHEFWNIEYESEVERKIKNKTT